MNKSPQWYAAFCYIFVPLAGLGVDLYTPSLPSVMRYFHTNASTAQLSLSIYLLGFGLSQLVCGPVTDRSGRKPMLIISLIAFFVLSLLISFSTTAWELLLGRCLQGVAGAGIAVPFRAMLADISDEKTIKKRMNYMLFAWGLGPTLAPWIGSHLQNLFSWKANFYFLGIYALLALIVVCFFKETHTGIKENREKPILANYKRVFSLRSFIPITLFSGLLYGMMILYGMVAPFLVEIKLKLSVLVFGRTALVMGVAWILGSLCNRAFINAKLSTKLSISFACMVVTVLVMGIVSHLYPLSLYALFVPVAALIFFGSIGFSALVTDTLSRFKSIAGSANAALFAILWVFAGIVSSVVSHLMLGTSFQFAITLFVITLLTIAIYFFVIRVLQKPETQAT